MDDSSGIGAWSVFCGLTPRRGAGALCILGTLVALSGARAHGQAGDPAARPGSDAPLVEVTAVTRRDLATTLTLAAEFRPFQEIDVHAKVAGYLKEIHVDLGDRVKAGQVLGIMELPEEEHDVEQAEAASRRAGEEVVRAASEVTRAQAAEALARETYDRLAGVVKARPNLVAQQDVDEAHERLRVGQAQVSAAQAALESARQQLESAHATALKMRSLLDYARLTAPFDGVVTRRYAHTGALIQAGTASSTQAMPIVRLSQNNLLRLVVAIPEAEVPRVRIGMPVSIRIPSLEMAIERKVTRMADRIDLETRTEEIEIDVDNADLRFVPGMYAYVDIDLERRPNVLAVPVTSVQRAEAGATAMVVGTDGVVEKRALKLGLETPLFLEVIHGLAEGEKLITGHSGSLAAGDHVQYVEARSAPVKEAR